MLNEMLSHFRQNGKPTASHARYGRFYYPWYNLASELPSETPPVYNADGERLDFFFIRDRHLAHNPYSSDMPPSHWLWDRYNFGLKTHFYTHGEMLDRMGRPDRRFGALIESPAIVPVDYEIFRRHPGLERDFDAIFTYDERILNEVANARFVPFCAQPWFGLPIGGGALDPEAFRKKSKTVSILSSDKTMCDLHKFRLSLAVQCKRDCLADTFGTFDGGPMVKVADTLTNYRYSIVVENSFSRYFFTERITSCFLAMTVPVYCGTGSIGEFFNEQGVISIRPGDDVKKVLGQCSEADYESRLPAILDNYRRAIEYRNIWDWLHDRYLGGEA